MLNLVFLIGIYVAAKPSPLPWSIIKLSNTNTVTLDKEYAQQTFGASSALRPCEPNSSRLPFLTQVSLLTCKIKHTTKQRQAEELLGQPLNSMFKGRKVSKNFVHLYFTS